MKGTFGDRIDVLKEAVGGKLTGAVEVDQVYAKYQHEGLDFEHPQGGSALFLVTPLFEKADEYMARLAEGAITEDGSNLVPAMRQNMEDLSEEVYERSPREFGDLRDSGHPSVTSGEELVYDRGPRVPRLSEEELKVKSKGRDLMKGTRR